MNSKDIVISIFSTVFKIVLAIIIVMLVYKWSISAYEYGQRVFSEPPMTVGVGRTITVVIEESDTVKEVSEMLEKKGLIRDAKLFRIQEFLSEYKDKIIPGTYELTTAMTTEEMLAVMAAKTETEE